MGWANGSFGEVGLTMTTDIFHALQFIHVGLRLLPVLTSEVRKKENERQHGIFPSEFENGYVEGGDQEIPYQSLPLSYMSSSSNRSALHLAVCKGSLKDTSSILQNADIDENGIRTLTNSKDDLGFTPLHSAVSIPSVTLSKNLTNLLLSTGADTNAIDALENTPLHWAARAGNSDVAQMLIMNGCPVGKTNRFKSPLLLKHLRSTQPLIVGYYLV